MKTTPQSDTTTEGIRIQAIAEFVPHESEPGNRRFVFSYRITMTNVGEQPAKLLSRHWIIVDGEGRREDVRGRGVIGEYPRLLPGESYSYKSFCPLSTEWGTMEGNYTFEREDGGRFLARIGRFFLVPGSPRLTVQSPSV
ncbi:MAG: Co2+/Mg2+ efflux protein ApaG [Planctomycetes bacterium]|nr:Co2+/Mg2+ efflux protein ApaG [Planctomycetota bacterium]MCB9887914.1 Co2+/Mg2+ efflux protein ApaG [Planctomycetota bacterium]